MGASKKARRRREAALPAMTGAACRRVRRRLGLTQVQFAERMGLQKNSIKRWESGRTPISRARAMAIQALAAQEFIKVEVPYPERRQEVAP